MAEHDFRYSMLSPQHTLTECRTLMPGRYQVTGNGGSIHGGDQLLVTLKGSKTLYMRLTVEKVRHLINPPGQWVAVASGPVFKELAIHEWSVHCDSCNAELKFEFSVESALGTQGQKPAAVARIAELGWNTVGDRHYCRKCQAPAA